MSKNKRQKIILKSDSQMKDSFDVRVCDDLSEELLQYLTIEDKLRLECVSKQFQRTVLTKQHHIVIGRKWGNALVNPLLVSNRCLTIDCKRVANVLKKCQNMTRITIGSNWDLIINLEK